MSIEIFGEKYDINIQYLKLNDNEIKEIPRSKKNKYIKPSGLICLHFYRL